jgi:hypothetical protein
MGNSAVYVSNYSSYKLSNIINLVKTRRLRQAGRDKERTQNFGGEISWKAFT